MKVVCLLILLSFFLLPLHSQAQSIESRVDRLILPLVKDNLISGSILIAKGAEILFKKGYGLANREWFAHNGGDTVYRLGSVSKQFTAMAVLMLVDRGMLHLDDTLNQYVPDFPRGDQITIHSLLNHSSGVRNYNQIKDYGEKLMLGMSIEDVIKWFRDETPVGKVGEQFAYSNSGYVLLAAVIEKVSGKTYSDFLRENIFSPLHMDHSGQDVFEVIIPRRASGYTCYDGEIILAPYRNLAFTSGAGSLYSTVEDLHNWTCALMKEGLISGKLQEKMWSPGKGNYGYGWFVRERFGRKLIEHAGAINGFGTQVQLFVDDGLVIISLYNFESSFQRRLDEALGAVALGLEAKPVYHPEGCPISEEAAGRFVGDYSLDERTQLLIRNTDKGLLARLSDGRSFVCLPQGDTALLIRELHWILQPYGPPQSPHEALLVNMGLNRFPARRITEAPKAQRK